METPRRQRAVVRITREGLIHNDIGGASYFAVERLRERHKSGDHAGITFDIMTALVWTAFAFEANMNYLGSKTVGKWDDWWSFGKKVTQIVRAVRHPIDEQSRPWSSVFLLKKIRDDFAHGKPKPVEKEWVAEGTFEEIKKEVRDYKSDLEKLVTLENAINAYEDCDYLWRTLLHEAGIEYFNTLDGGSDSIETIEHLD